MDSSKLIAVVVIAVGLGICIIALVTHPPRFAAMLFLGAALVIGPLSPLTRGQLPDSVRIGFSAISIVLSILAIASGGLTLFRGR